MDFRDFLAGIFGGILTIGLFAGAVGIGALVNQQSYREQVTDWFGTTTTTTDVVDDETTESDIIVTE